MNPMDRPSGSRQSATSKSPRKSVIEVIDLDDEEDFLFLEDPKQIHLNDAQKEEADDSMQKQLEIWRNYGKRKLSKLEMQHEDDADFYGFASTLLQSDEESLRDFKDYLDRGKKFVENLDENDTYEDIDTTVLCLTEELNFGRSHELKNLFAGVCIWVNGWTYPVAKNLHQFMTMTGGEFCLTYNTNKVTHIISTVISMSNAKIEKHQQNTVNPEWILDSLKEHKLLDLFDYRVLKPKNDIKRMFQKQYKKNRLISNAADKNKNGKDKDKDDSDEIRLVDHFPKSPAKPAFREGPSSLKIPKLQPTQADKNNFLPRKLSDIDTEFLDALPPEIVKELKEQYNDFPSTSSSTTSTSDLKPKLRQQTLTFQNVTKVPNKILVASRKPKQSSGQEQPKIYVLIKKQKDRDSKGRMVDLFSGKLDPKLGPNLCGRSDIEGVIELLEEWILTFDDLTDEDVSYIVGFFDSLMHTKKYDNLLEILKHTRGFIDQRISAGGVTDSWRNFFFETLKSFFEGESEFALKIPKGLFMQ